MNKQEIFEDFIVFFLLQYEELNSGLGYFYNQINGESLFEIEQRLNYQDFIRQSINLSSFNLNQKGSINLSKLEDLLSAVETEKLLEYLNSEFTYGFPRDHDDDYNPIGGFFQLTVTQDEIREDFNLYIKLHEINPNIYISQLVQFYYEDSISLSSKLNKRINEINNISFTLPETLQKDFLDYKLGSARKKLFKDLEKYPFQYHGFFDNNGLFLDHELTLEKWVEISTFVNISNEVIMPVNTGSDYLYYQNLYYKVYGKVESSENNQALLLKKELETLIKEYDSLKTFLTKKGFSQDEIKIIFNFLCNNKFNDLKLRHIECKQIEFFRYCYLFYIFDYLTENFQIDFSKESDFNKLNINNCELNNSSRNNQFKKYYDNIKSNRDHKNYPFRTVNHQKIEDRLKISKGKLKNIPFAH